MMKALEKWAADELRSTNGQLAWVSGSLYERQEAYRNQFQELKRLKSSWAIRLNTIFFPMKKIIILSFSILSFFLINSNSSFAQDALRTRKEVKLQKKMDSAITNLEESKEYLEKLRKTYAKSVKKFEKDNSKGKLSPNSVSVHAKSIEKQRKKIEDVKKEIETLEKYIAKNQV